jgi:hypothetical protein
MTNSIFSAKRRALLLSAAAAGLVLSGALVASPALAANECGTPSAGAVTCTSTSAGATNGVFTNGITYTTVGAPLALTANNTVQSQGPIQVTTTGGAATINNSGTVTAAQSALGGVAATATNGDATIVNAGAVSTSAAGTAGLYANSTGGNVSITNSATVSATGANANGISATSTGGTIAITNSGSITGASNGFGIQTTGGPATIDNTGTINGPVSLAGNGNVFNNNAGGTWNATGTSTFSSFGTDVVNNSGTVVAATPSGATTASTATFTNLHAFNNSGIVDVSTGNSISMPSASFNGLSGSKLYVSGVTESGSLTVASSTGTTAVVPIDVFNGRAGVLNSTGQNIVFGASPDTFTMLGGGSDFRRGFIDYRLTFTPASGSNPSVYTLFGLPGPEVFEALSIPYAAQTYWRHSGDAWTQRAIDIRDSQVGSSPSRPEGWEAWVTPFGGHDKFDRAQTFGFGDFTFDQIGTHTAFFGLQAGADVLSKWNNGYGYWGFTAGVQQQETDFIDDNQNDLYLLGGNIGMYGGANWGGLYVNGLGKIDFIDLNANFNSANFNSLRLWETYGAKGEVGYRWPFGGFYVEPAFRISAIWTSTNNLNPAGATLRFDQDDPFLLGEAGGRVGTTLGFFGYQFTGYGGAFWVDQFQGKNRMVFVTPGSPTGSSDFIDLDQRQLGNFIRVEGGLETGAMWGGLKGFFKGQDDINGDGVGGWNAMMGFRFSF